MSEKYRVRLAQRYERQELFDAVKLCHDENGIFPLSERKVMAAIDRALNSMEGHGEGSPAVVGVIGPPGQIEASLFLSVEQPNYSDAWHLIEYWNFCHPDFRAPAGRASALLEWAKTVSAKMQLPVIIGIVSNERTNAKIRLYERHVKHVGAFFLHDPTGLVANSVLDAGIRSRTEKKALQARRQQARAMLEGSRVN